MNSYRICNIRLDGVNSALLRDGVALPIGRRAVMLLLHLVRQKGEIVSKRALYDAAWPGQTVEESNLTVQISHLRRVLETAAPGGGRWVETLPRRGYRYVGPADADEKDLREIRTRRPVSNIPIAVPLHFTGREAALAAMRAALRRHGTGPSIVALHGMRGLGKTVLAAAFAGVEAVRYRATWWVRAEEPATVRADLAALACRLGWARPEAPEALAFNAALDGLQVEGEGVLLIYDNAVDAASLRPVLPKSGDAHVIVTSNSNVWRALATPIEPEMWQHDTGAEFLIVRTGRGSERAAAGALSQALGGLPLAHEQAAAYVENLGIPLAEYQRRLEAAPGRMLDDPAHAPADYHGGLTVAKALHLAIVQAGALHPAAPSLLQHLAMLAAEPIPLTLFRKGRAAFSPALAAMIEDGRLEEAVSMLRRLALVDTKAPLDDHDSAGAIDCVRIHRLVRQIVASQTPSDLKPGMRAALTRAMVAVYPADVFDNIASWGLARYLDPLAKPLVQPLSVIAPGAEACAVVLLDRLASYCHGSLGAYDQAKALHEQGLALSEAHHGADHKMTASSTNNLALVLRDCGELTQARPLHERALNLRRAIFGDDHPEVAVSLNNLANVICEAGNPADAIPLMQRALAIRQAHFGEGSSQAAQFMSNLARHLHLAGNIDGARPLLERALSIRETVLGANDPNTANSMANLALLLLDVSELDRATQLSERALQITETALGPEHPLVVSVCAIYAQCLLPRRGPSTALPFAERALTLGAGLLTHGSQHLRRAAKVTAHCLDALGRDDDAANIRARYPIA